MGENMSRGRTNSREEMLNRRANQQIDRNLRREEDKDKAVNKILVLGAGFSGKSTFLKMLLYAYEFEKRYPPDKLEKSRAAIHSNYIELLVQAVKQSDKFQYQRSDVCEQFMLHFDDFDDSRDNAPALSGGELKLILQVAQDPVIAQTIERSYEWSLLLFDNHEYLMEHARRILSENYQMIFEDFIRCRQPTTGVTHYEFSYPTKNGSLTRYNITDVGGQRSERKKWIWAFDNVMLVIYLCALSGYNQLLYEDDKKNRLLESLDLFESMLSRPALRTKNCIIFLNKNDIFERKIRRVPFNVSGLFNDYRGDQHSSQEVIDYVRRKFSTLNGNSRRLLYFHVTNSTDVDNIEYVFAAVHDTVTREALQVASLI